MKVMFVCRGAEYLGIEYLSSHLKTRGHTTDLLFDPGFDDTFFFRAPFLKGLNRWPRLIKQVKDFQPDLLAVSSVSNTYPYIRALLKEIRQAFNCYTVIGGAHASAAPEHLLKEGLFDAVCIGESEGALLELVDYLQAGENPTKIKNLCFLQGEKIIRNPLRPLIQNLDTLPLPDKNLFYKSGAFSTTLTTLSGRGCPYSCSFCINSQWRDMYRGLGPYVRRYSPERMIDELRYFIKRYPIKRINFQDDIFTMDKQWLTQFCESYSRLIGLPFQCNGHPHFLSKETARLLKMAGCVSVCLGVQTARYDKRASLLVRPETNEEIESAVALLKKYRIQVYLEYIFGLPGETIEDIKANLEFNHKLRPANTATFMFYPFPGTPLLHYCQERGLINSGEVNRVFKGEGSYHYSSLIQLPNKRLSETAANLFPGLKNLPPSLSIRIIRWLSYDSFQGLVRIIGLLLLPLSNFFQFRERVSNYFHMFFKSQRR